jgi:hypothetical protein
MLTVTTSLRQQSRPVLPYLVAALQANLEHRPFPSILPHSQSTASALP